MDSLCSVDKTSTMDTAPPEVDDTGLAELFQGVHMDGVFYCPSIFSEPWGVSLPPMGDCVWFHVVTSGSGMVAVDGATEPRPFHRGDLLLVPHGTGHRAWGATPAPTPSVLDLPHDTLSDRYGVLRHGGGGERTELVCGGVRFVHPAARTLIEALPRVIHIAAADVPRRDWLRTTLDLIDDETRQTRPGSDVIVSRLCDIIVVQAIRHWIENDPAARTGWLGALRDARIDTTSVNRPWLEIVPLGRRSSNNRQPRVAHRSPRLAMLTLGWDVQRLRRRFGPQRSCAHTRSIRRSR